MSNVVIVTDKNFQDEVEEARVPVLVDFWASWCPPCKMVEPTIKEIAEELNGMLKVVKLNVDQNPRTSKAYDVLGLPTFAVFQGGKVLERRVGSQSKEMLLEMIQSNVGEM